MQNDGTYRVPVMYYYDVQGFCDELQIGKTLLFKFILEGKVNSELINRRRLIPVEELERFIIAQIVSPKKRS